MAVLLQRLFFLMQYFLHSIGFFEYNLQIEGLRFPEISAIFNLTLRPPYAILLSDYPADNHSSRIQEDSR